MDLELFTTAGLGDTSYLVASRGEAALVDPQRDAWRFLAVAERRGWRVTHVLETHVHNDYLSGALETRAATRAEIVAPARGGYAFAHRGADEGTEISVGALRITAMATPGHTPEHLAWAVRSADGAADAPPEGVFTGGSLLVGSAGRTDLLGDARTEELTRLQAASLRRLAKLPAAVRILPTHGAGSFCSAGPVAATRTTTMGRELVANLALEAAGGGSFHDVALGHLGRYPAYYDHMAALNLAGPAVLGELPATPQLDADALARALTAQVHVVDGRPRAAYAAEHVPGSLNIELDESFAAYVGWLVPFNAPVAFILPDPEPEALTEARSQLLRIGYDDVAGYLAGGIGAWLASGLPISAYPTTSMEAVYGEAAAGSPPAILDVRQPIEWRDDGVIPGAQTIFVADLPERLDALPRDRPLTVLCRSGARSAIAASLLDNAGFDVRLVAEGGSLGWPDRFKALEAGDARGRTPPAAEG
jgi:glyoxylase-like metal-dependent hydrolase (beta-lactamase superfamily II)/rhodanese-related sulfurtransferase